MEPVITGNNVYCGPAVVAALLGVTTDEASKLLKGHEGVKGTWYREVVPCLERHGKRLVPVHLEAKKTVLRFAQSADPNAVYLIGTRNHWLVVHCGTVWDNHAPRPVKPEEYKLKSLKVKDIWEVR